MKIEKKSIIIYIAPILLISCDCFKFMKGEILDSSSLKPIRNAKIENENFSYSIKTDSLGKFEGVYKSLGFFCPKLKLSISANGYKLYETTHKKLSKKDTIFMVKIK